MILDTNLYIDWLNTGQHEAVLLQPGVVKYMSAVVMMELLAGAFSARDRKLLSRLFDTFARLDRVVVPSAGNYREAGEVVRQLKAAQGHDPTRTQAAANDVLIALSARSIGATVVTQDKKDFLAIQSARSFKLSLVS